MLFECVLCKLACLALVHLHHRAMTLCSTVGEIYIGDFDYGSFPRELLGHSVEVVVVLLIYLAD